MARGDFPSAKQDQYMVRFPDGMRDRLKEAAEKTGRSMNAEIVARLEQSFGLSGNAELFSSREMYLWALLTANAFQKAGAAEAARRGIDPADDKKWMADPECLISASRAAMRAMVRELAELPISHADNILLTFEALKGEFLTVYANTGRLNFPEGSFVPIMSSFDKPEDESK